MNPGKEVYIASRVKDNQHDVKKVETDHSASTIIDCSNISNITLKILKNKKKWNVSELGP